MKEQKNQERMNKRQEEKMNDPQYLMKEIMNANWIEEEIDGKKIVHDKKKERWIPDLSHPIENEYKIFWRRQNDYAPSILRYHQWLKLIQQFPILDTKAKICYDKEKKEYVLHKDQRIPGIIVNIKIVEKRDLHICQMRVIDQNNTWIPMPFQDVLRKQNEQKEKYREAKRKEKEKTQNSQKTLQAAFMEKKFQKQNIRQQQQLCGSKRCRMDPGINKYTFPSDAVSKQMGSRLHPQNPEKKIKKNQMYMDPNEIEKIRQLYAKPAAAGQSYKLPPGVSKQTLKICSNQFNSDISNIPVNIPAGSEVKSSLKERIDNFITQAEKYSNKENVEENLYSKYLKEDARVDPEIECKEEKISYKMSLSAKGVQTSEIYGNGAALLEQIFSQFEGEYEKISQNQEFYQKGQNMEPLQKIPARVDPQTEYQVMQTSYQEYHDAQGVHPINDFDNWLEEQYKIIENIQPIFQEKNGVSSCQKEKLISDQIEIQNNLKRIDPQMHQQPQQTIEKHSPDAQGVHSRA